MSLLSFFEYVDWKNVLFTGLICLVSLCCREDYFREIYSIISKWFSHNADNHADFGLEVADIHEFQFPVYRPRLPIVQVNVNNEDSDSDDDVESYRLSGRGDNNRPQTDTIITHPRGRPLPRPGHQQFDFSRPSTWQN